MKINNNIEFNIMNKYDKFINIYILYKYNNKRWLWDYYVSGQR